MHSCWLCQPIEVLFLDITWYVRKHASHSTIYTYARSNDRTNGIHTTPHHIMTQSYSYSYSYFFRCTHFVLHIPRVEQYTVTRRFICVPLTVCMLVCIWVIITHHIINNNVGGGGDLNAQHFTRGSDWFSVRRRLFNTRIRFVSITSFLSQLCLRKEDKKEILSFRRYFFFTVEFFQWTT